jgi:uncharacterized protein YabN with tetrapyrrole methylase and pyrophosphatase domain
MTEENKNYVIKRIIFWLREIEEYNEILSFLNNYKDVKATLCVKVEGISSYSKIFKRKTLVMKDDMVSRYYGFLEKEVKHIEGLVAESDQELVEVAKAIRSGEINSDGFAFR